MNITFKQLVMGFQLFAAITAGSVGAFKGKEMLHEYLTRSVAVITRHGENKQFIAGSGQYIAIRIPVRKTKMCRLVNAERQSATLRQGDDSSLVVLESIGRIRPQEYVQNKVFKFDIPEEYDMSNEAVLIVDLEYSCREGREAVYLDIPIRALSSSEQQHIHIMQQVRKLDMSARNFNERGTK